jgi:hypothetical protein
MKDLIEELRLRHANVNGADTRIKEPFVGPTIFLEAANAIEQLMQERDKARRIFCAMIATGNFNARDPSYCLDAAAHIAKTNGWDCMDELIAQNQGVHVYDRNIAEDLT